MIKTKAAIAFGITMLLMLSLLSAIAPAARAAGPCAETAYANGQLYCIFIAKIIANPSPGLLTAAEPIYIAAYFASASPTAAFGSFVLPTSQLGGCDITNPSNCDPVSLPSGYQPLCNPCFHGGFLNNLPYHDHVLAGSPGFGSSGTAGEMVAPWVLILVAYDPTYSNQAGFTPFKSTVGIVAGESAGDFLPINPTASNPYEINTGVVIIFGVQPLG